MLSPDQPGTYSGSPTVVQTPPHRVFAGFAAGLFAIFVVAGAVGLVKVWPRTLFDGSTSYTGADWNYVRWAIAAWIAWTLAMTLLAVAVAMLPGGAVMSAPRTIVFRPQAASAELTESARIEQAQQRRNLAGRLAIEFLVGIIAIVMFVLILH